MLERFVMILNVLSLSEFLLLSKSHNLNQISFKLPVIEMNRDFRIKYKHFRKRQKYLPWGIGFCGNIDCPLPNKCFPLHPEVKKGWSMGALLPEGNGQN